MLITVPNNSAYESLNDCDLIAITKNDKFIGYATVFSKGLDIIVLDVDKKIYKILNELISEDIPFDFNISV